jgi:hypothetical protein
MTARTRALPRSSPGRAGASAGRSLSSALHGTGFRVVAGARTDPRDQHYPSDPAFRDTQAPDFEQLFWGRSIGSPAAYVRSSLM